MVAVNSAMIPLGTEAPQFSLPDPAGKLWAFDDVAGEKGTLVAFLCNHCPFVKHIAQPFGEAAARWSDAGIGVVGINSNDPDAYPDEVPERMAEQSRAWGWNFPYLSDAEQSAALAYHAACTPDLYLFDSGRRLVYRGRFDASTPGNNEAVTGENLSAAVDAVLSGRPVPGDQIPSIGCNVKWKPGNEPPWYR
ncbi:thioredoxin family protein [Hoyosella altamirensis]|uniref:Peroxiredoxin n=1 Tax=Hoyosella altamirensis TaxID=616997 RepID=A0A839RKX7_9ACTN|nr:thioredoxin family protein [Hoyosella altamirensis]MBB3036713.1 peroxiredoxin [Hoyosella altamirensis]